jgi:general secretion pathway protein G
MNHKRLNFISKGFTLMELLIVIAIIGILVTLSGMTYTKVQEQSRDARRKADLELIKSGIEIYKADCNAYPGSLTVNTALVGSGTPTGCSASNTYINLVPADPKPTTRNYVYRTVGSGFEICASLEESGLDTINCGSSCGGSGCNYQVINP